MKQVIAIVIIIKKGEPMKKTAMTMKKTNQLIKDKVNDGVDAIKTDTRVAKQLIQNKVNKGVDTIKEDTKEARKVIQNKVNKSIDAVKEETSVAVGKIKMGASEANRKGKAAVRAIRS